jgi:hypothetical protein
LLSLQPGASLWVLELGEPDENVLRIVAVEAMPNGEPEDFDAGILAVPVAPTAASRTFEIVWDSYASYLIENESYSMPLSEELSGRGLHVTSSSQLLDFVSSTGIAPQVLGQLMHWCLVCDRHVVHVVGASPPTIKTQDHPTPRAR